MPDGSAVDAAIVSKLIGDGQLMALLTDGVYWGVAAGGKTKFGIVSLSMYDDTYMESGTAYEQGLYLVKAVTLSNDTQTARTAYARMHNLLQDVALTVSGYSLMCLRRVSRFREAEPDGSNPELRWQHWGGYYEVWVSPS